MNKRLRKKAERRKRELIHELLDMVLDINGLGGRKQCFTGNLPTMFFNFSGHVGWISLKMYKNGWIGNIDPDVDCSLYAEQMGDLTKAVRLLRGIKAETPGAATPRGSR